MKLLSLATVQPESIGQGKAAVLAEPRCCRTPGQTRLLHTLYRATQVDQRGSVLLTEGDSGESFYPAPADGDDRGPGTQQRMARYERDAPPLARAAADRALHQADIDPRQVTHLVTASCTGFAAPGFDIDLIDTLGLRATVARTHVGFMGCHGAFNALRVAEALTSDPDACVLLCAVELCSLHFHYGWETGRVVANALFADGAAAAVLARGRGDEAWRYAGGGSCLVPGSRDAMTWRIGDHGFEMTLSPQVPELIESNLRAWLEPWLRERGLGVAEVGSWAVHPGGPRILDAVQSALSLPAEAMVTSRQVLARCGNMSSPTVLFILEALRVSGAARPCVALGFGPGLTAEVMLWR
jgi:predicted naringenin-chalcone synthase